MNDVYQVHYWHDDRNETPGKCRTDHPVKPGDTIYTQHGRAIVRSCRLMREARVTAQGSDRTIGWRLA